MPTVSVVIPTFNRSDILPRAIDNVLAQTFDDFEVLVVDDGSTDDTQAVIDEYGDDRLTYIQHGTNRGAPAARNTGIEYAEGEYVAFLDSDDVWDGRKLEKQLRAIAEKPDDEDWIGAYCDFELHAAGRTGWFRTQAAAVLSRGDDEPPREGDADVIPEILAGKIHPAGGSTLLVESEVAREIGGFDEELTRFQDSEFMLRILEEGKLVYLDESLVTRFMTPVPAAETIESASQQYLGKHVEKVREYEADGYEIRGAHYLVLSKEFFKEGRPLRGLSYLHKSNLRARHVPGLVWALGRGARYRAPSPDFGRRRGGSTD